MQTKKETNICYIRLPCFVVHQPSSVGKRKFHFITIVELFVGAGNGLLKIFCYSTNSFKNLGNLLLFVI